ncbi:ABC transporter ATP-binding protein [Labrenzia sp. OB1]|uniref:ABC transporter ATP-binding protein n=1 Tax=Labrenzia sp. OB1 TaxID=1561204 RepID=UPI0007B1D0A7|nr:ABC transporter ATP-binding protein [Labrenzia sp. OB1]KZM51160.1 branched-chain amino acid ABC transporter ATPase [Labrenzia sp. OB1]
MGEPILKLKGVSRSFGDFVAVDRVSLNIRSGSITGLIGPNGAGKSTLFNVIAGDLAPSAGRVVFDEQDISGFASERRFAAGLGRTFQIPRPFKRMSVLENVMLAPLDQDGEGLLAAVLGRARIRAQEAAIRKRALEVLDFVTLHPLADQPAGKISGGQMKLLELARVLMGDPKLILLDEPAAGVNPALTEVLIGKIEELNRDGKTFLIIEHDMDFVMRHCDPVIALAEGCVIFEGTAAEAQSNPVLLDVYLGAPVDA